MTPSVALFLGGRCITRSVAGSSASQLFVVLGCVIGCTPAQTRTARKNEFWGFTAPWDPRSARSVAAHGAQLDAIVSGWIALDSTSFQPVVLVQNSTVIRTGTHQRYMALVTSYQGTRFHPEVVRGIAEDSTVLAITAGPSAQRSKVLAAMGSCSTSKG